MAPYRCAFALAFRPAAGPVAPLYMYTFRSISIRLVSYKYNREVPIVQQFQQFVKWLQISVTGYFQPEMESNECSSTHGSPILVA